MDISRDYCCLLISSIIHQYKGRAVNYWALHLALAKIQDILKSILDSRIGFFLGIWGPI